MSCLIILFTVELAGSYLGHVPTSSEKYLPQINYGRKLTCLDVVHASVITDLFAIGCSVAELRVSAL